MTTVVVGAGITGLAAAVALRGADRQVVVREASDRAGGPVRTVRRDGWVLEQGPQSIRGGAPEVGRLLDLLRMQQRVVKASPAAAARFLLSRGRLVKVGGNPRALARLMRKRDVARMMLEPVVPRGGVPEESVRDFVRRRIGEGATEALLGPVIAGIYGGDPSRIEASSGLSKIWRWEQEHGSLFRGALAAPKATEPKGSFTFVHGMQELIDALGATAGPDLHLSDAVERIERVGDGFRVHTADGERLAADRVVLTCPPHVAGRLVPELSPPELPVARVVAIHLGYRTSDVGPPAQGFGWLAHRRELPDVLGCLWVSSTFPSHAPPGTQLYRLMVGGARDPSAADRSDEALVARARQVLADVQGIRAEPVLVDVSRPAGIPQYPAGWGSFLTRARAIPGLAFAGWSWGGIGVADGITAAFGLT
ncbi:MAG: protoporphyrinogen oxidase [Alphaproteobacteria bacterium]|nr:protoporphyrinogen oxidase [Alphaproteobacteria bacterium]